MLSVAMRVHNPDRMKYWEIIADNLHDAGWSLGWVSGLNREGRTIRQNINAMLSRAAVSHMQNINGQIIGSK
jgi:hypothetical protein